MLDLDMSRLITLLLVIVPVAASADPASVTEAKSPPLGRLGATVGYQRTDRNAWVFGPALEIHIYRDFSIRGEAQLELGNFDDPFGDSNIRVGDGPHVNHVIFGPVWRPEKYAKYDGAVGIEGGELVMHSRFAEQEFTKGVAIGAFVQAGKPLGPVVLALQLRLDVSKTISMGGPMGVDVPTTSGRINFAFEVPLGK